MVIKFSISISKFTFEEIEKQMQVEEMKNRSEFIQEMIRIGIIEIKKKRYQK